MLNFRLTRWLRPATVAVVLAVPGLWAQTSKPAPAATLPKPVIRSVITASAYGAYTSFTGGTWIEIYGTNLAKTNRSWTADDFIGSFAPTSLDGVSVSVNGRPGYPALLVHGDSDQLNVQAPTDGAITGDATIVVTVDGQSSDPFTLHEDAKAAPGFLAPPSYKVNGKPYIVGVFSDMTPDHRLIYACPPNSIDGLVCRLPKPGEILTFYGVGFGLTSRLIPAGMVTPGSFNLVDEIHWKFGDKDAVVQFGGLAGLSFGLYQFNVVVPDVPAGEYALTVTIGSQSVPQTLNLQISATTTEN